MLTCRQVVNKTVISSDGRILGRLASAFVDEEWRIPAFSILVERGVAETFRIRSPLFGGPRRFFEPSEITALSDNVILKRRLEEMREYLMDKGTGIEANNALGWKVLGEGNYHLGDLQDLAIDKGHWRMTDLVVEVRKKAADEMGLPMSIFGSLQAKVPVRQVESFSGQVILALNLEGFKEHVIKERSRG